jgi:hypothetical protein
MVGFLLSRGNHFGDQSRIHFTINNTYTLADNFSLIRAATPEVRLRDS